MKCYQCNKPAIFSISVEGGQIPLCLDCKLKLDQSIAIQQDLVERNLNFLAAEMESVAGLPGTLPRYPTRHVVKADQVTQHNVNVSNSSIGVLNTGSMQMVNSAAASLSQGGQKELAQANCLTFRSDPLGGYRNLHYAQT